MRYCLLLGLTLMGSVWAQEVPQRNMVQFDAVASREVANDLAQASLFVELSDADPSRLADKVNQALAAALKMTKQYPAVQLGASTYNTYPLYSHKSNKQEGWRSRGELRVSSKDFAALSKLIAELQSGKGLALQLAEVRYAVSEEQRRTVEDALIEEGLTAFQRRAALIQKGMAAKSWRLVNVNVSTSGARPEPRPMMMKAAMMDAAAPAPIEGGESRMQVNISGSIQLAE